MKNSLSLLCVIPLFLISSCNPVETIENVKDTLDATKCLSLYSRLSNNEDDYSCKELVSELKSLKNSCSAYQDDADMQELIDLLEASEDCNN